MTKQGTSFAAFASAAGQLQVFRHNEACQSGLYHPHLRGKSDMPSTTGQAACAPTKRSRPVTAMQTSHASRLRSLHTGISSLSHIQRQSRAQASGCELLHVIIDRPAPKLTQIIDSPASKVTQLLGSHRLWCPVHMTIMASSHSLAADSHTRPPLQGLFCGLRGVGTTASCFICGCPFGL